MTDGSAQPRIDWRDWITFLGYVVVTAMVISVVLASLVLIISTQADETPRGLAAPAESPAALPARSAASDAPLASTAAPSNAASGLLPASIAVPAVAGAPIVTVPMATVPVVAVPVTAGPAAKITTPVVMAEPVPGTPTGDPQ